MKGSLVSAAFFLVGSVSAHPGHGAHHHRHHARQAPTPVAAAPALGYTATTVISGIQIVTTYSVPPTVTFSLFSTNPTAVPVASIVAGAPSQVSIALPTSFTAGAVQTFVPGAPPLPDHNLVIPTNYPPQDQTPPTDSPQVLQWIQEVENSGVLIPNLTVTAPGGCWSNEDIMNDQSRCWWTCSGCVRDTDVTICPDPMTWGLTYDDGPSAWTPNLLAFLEQHNLHGTFFSIGSRAIESPDIFQYEFMTGHQIGVHTWSHPVMTTLTNEEIIAELGWTKQLFKEYLGVTPNTWRPPYGDVDDRVRAIASAMGLTTVIWSRLNAETTFDTFDYDVAGDLVSVSEVLGNFSIIAENATHMDTGFILLEHDLFQQTVDIATGYILPDALAYQPPFDIKPVVQCLNMPLSNAYIETNDNATNPPAQSEAPAPTSFLSSAAYSSASASVTANPPASTASSAEDTDPSVPAVDTTSGATQGVSLPLRYASLLVAAVAAVLAFL